MAITSMVPLDLTVTIGVILGTCILGKFIRVTLESILRPGLLLNLLLEGVASCELCAVSFEAGLLFEMYGKHAFGTAIFFICLWRCYHWRNVSTLPYAHLESWLRGALPLIRLILFIGIEVAFGALAYRYYTKIVWSFGLSQIHIRKFGAVDACRTLVRVDYLTGIMVEFGCTFLCGLLMRILLSMQSIGKFTPVFKSLIITFCIMTGFEYTGGFMSPVLATMKQFGCSGITPLQHFLVYWVGDSLGALAIAFSWEYLRSGRQITKKEN